MRQQSPDEDLKSMMGPMTKTSKSRDYQLVVMQLSADGDGRVIDVFGEFVMHTLMLIRCTGPRRPSVRPPQLQWNLSPRAGSSRSKGHRLRSPAHSGERSLRRETGS